MDRFKPLDVTTSSLGAVLASDEEVLSLVPGVGLYDGRDKALHHTSGTIYVTNLRLIYVDDAQPHRYSCHLDWRLVKATEYYAGFLKSSPKVTLILAAAEDAKADGPDAAGGELSAGDKYKGAASGDWRRNVRGAFDAGSDAAQIQTSWVCRICGYSNDANTVSKCQLCGVARDPAAEATASTARRRSEAAAATSVKPLQTGPKSGPSGEIACPTCTFLNHPSMLRCEICDSALGTIFPAATAAPDRPKSAAAVVSTQSSANRSTPSLRDEASPTRQPGDLPQLPWSQARAAASAEATPPSAPPDHVKLSFRKGGVQDCYALIRSTLKAKAWLKTGSAPRGPAVASDIDGRGAAMPKAGIDGILRAADTTTREQKADIEDALKDLEGLMQKAKQMVDLAESLNSKLLRQEAASGQGTSSALGQSVEGQVVTESSAAATLIRSSLVQLGLPAPAVTEDMAKDEMEYHQELARELAQILLGENGLMGRGTIARKGQTFPKAALPQYLQSSLSQGRGLISLDEVWCVWNRARGVALVSPKALHTVASKFLAQVTQPPIDLRKFNSGLCVLHTPRFSVQAFEQRLVQLVTRAGANEASSRGGGGVSSVDIAREEDLPILLATEMTELVEATTGAIIRDDGARGGTLWYPNLILQSVA